MIKNYFKVAWRTLFHNKLYTILNVAGLTFGISCFLLIGLYIFDELTFDQYHSKADRIYRVIEHKNTNGEQLVIAAASLKLAEESKKFVSEVESTTRILRTGRALIINPDNKKKFQETIAMADESLLTIFDFELIGGNRNTALKEPNSIILTETLAKLLFGSANVVGKTVLPEFMETPQKITAVLKDHPRNSSFDFTLMMAEATFRNEDYFKNTASNWSSQSFSVYALLKDNADPVSAAKGLTALVHKNFSNPPGVTNFFTLQALKDMRLYSEDIVDGARNANVGAIGQGKLIYLKVFAVVALFVLLTACVNYMNLTTARASNRAREIGIRKSVGAYKNQLVYQFLLESFIVTFLSFLLAILVVNLVLPAFNQFTNKELSLGISSDYRIWLMAVASTILLGFLSGTYPALFMSGFKPVSLLKKMKLNYKGGLSLRRTLVVFQFTISVVMIIATMVLSLQVRYLNNKDLGFNKDQLVVADINSGAVRKGAETIKTEFSKIRGVKDVAISSRVPGEWKSIPTVKISDNNKRTNEQIAYLIGADESFFKTFEVELLNGRNFVNSSDSASVILNEAAAAKLNIKEASNQLVDIPVMAFGGSYFPVNDDSSTFTARVIGIVKDFHFQSLREKIAPLVLAYRQNPVHNIDYFTARIDGRETQAVLKAMANVITSVDEGHLFEYHFLDEQLALFYTEDKRRETLLISVALATVFIACLGLFGLATYAAEQRIKEIGIRKVLGAGTAQLTTLLSKDFLKLVFVANGIAFPLAWWAANEWLKEFAYHIEVRWWVFVGAGMIALLIALLTVSFQAIRAAIANPVRSLRTE